MSSFVSAVSWHGSHNGYNGHLACVLHEDCDSWMTTFNVLASLQHGPLCRHVSPVCPPYVSLVCPPYVSPVCPLRMSLTTNYVWYRCYYRHCIYSCSTYRARYSQPNVL